jgi:hypothetical protein
VIGPAAAIIALIWWIFGFRLGLWMACTIALCVELFCLIVGVPSRRRALAAISVTTIVWVIALAALPRTTVRYWCMDGTSVLVSRNTTEGEACVGHNHPKPSPVASQAQPSQPKSAVAPKPAVAYTCMDGTSIYQGQVESDPHVPFDTAKRAACVGHNHPPKPAKPADNNPSFVAADGVRHYAHFDFFKGIMYGCSSDGKWSTVPNCGDPIFGSRGRAAASSRAKIGVDLVLTDRVTYEEGGYIKVTGTVKNVGDDAAYSPNVHVEVYDDSMSTLLAQHDTWPAGQSFAYMKPGVSAAFETYVHVPGEPGQVRVRVSIEKYPYKEVRQ